MTREEIMRLNTDYLNGRESEHEMNELFNYVLELQKHEQDHCEDAISRQAVLEAMYNLCGEGALENNPWRDNPHIDAIVDAILDLSSVTPQPKIGRWIEERNDYGKITHWHCSNCYDDSGFITTCKWDYCPNCGKRMEVEE